MAEVRRVLQALQQPEDQRSQRLWWSRFRRVHQAEAKRLHWRRRARQGPMSQYPGPLPIQLLGVAQPSDAQWEKIRQLLPRYVSQTKRHLAEPRLIVEAILWVMNTGSSWREIPERFGSWSNVAERYYRWCREGKWALILQVLQEQEVPISSSA